MAPKTEYELVCETVATYQSRLEKIWAKTDSHEHTTRIDEAMRGLRALAWDLERDRPVPGTTWTRPATVMAAITLAEKAENETVRWHSRVSWGWFIANAIILIALVALYLFLHWPEAPKAANGTTPDATAASAATSGGFFWEEGPKKYAEIAFWVLAGLLVFVLYSIQHLVREGWDVGLYGLWYISKLLQGVLIGFVIVLFFVQFKFTVAGLDVDFSTAPAPILVILAFILGYYSEKARDYLDVIRDRFLAGTDMPEVAIEAPLDDVPVTRDSVVVRGKVVGPHGMKGTLAVGKSDPVELKLDSSGNFAHQIEVVSGVNLIKVEATGPNGKAGSKGIAVTRLGPGLVLSLTSVLPTAPVHQEALRLEGLVKDDAGAPAPASPVYLLIDRKDPLRTTTDVNGAFAFNLKLSPGSNVMKVVAGQPDGDIVTESVDVTYEPNVPGVVPP